MIFISNLTKDSLPFSKSVFNSLKEKILGKKYNLSLVFVTSSKSKSLNKKYRKKDKPANVLSFPVEDSVGEIFINIQTKKEAKGFGLSHKDFLKYLFIHGCLHLKGLSHGNEMENLEDKYLNT